MVDRRRACCGALIASLLTWVATRPETDGSAILEAGTPTSFQDLDGDFLPDVVEHVLVLDPSRADTVGDGVPDFLHAVQSRFPNGLGDTRTDHEFRVCVTEQIEPSGAAVLWVHYLARVVDGGLSAITDFRPFLDVLGQQFVLNHPVASAPLDFATREHPQEGLFVRLSVCLGPSELLRQSSMLPCTIGARVVIGGLPISSAVLIRETSGVLTALVPLDPDGMGLQTLAVHGNDDPFWRSNRVCRLRLALVGITNGGVVCEVTETFCVVDPTRRLSCPPTCEASLGRVLFIPDGMRTITGGSY